MIARLQLALFLAASMWCAAQTPHKPLTAPAKPAQDEQLYRNPTFGFRCRIPYGWVDRTRDMRDQATAETADSPQGEVLLAVFERPPDAPGDTVNSAVVIASESAAAYPKLKKAEDYLEPLTELTAAQGFKADGDPTVIAIDTRQLVRADFIKPLTEKLAMHQSTFVLLAKGRIVSFTFIAGSEDEVDQLAAGLHFVAGR
jgi:hypothetical protein